jgi:group I intron endonuclease
VGTSLCGMGQKTVGVYVIRQISTGKCYVGQSVHVERRVIHHRYHLRKGKHHNHYLQSAWNKYGENDFTFSLLRKCEHHELTSLEQSLADEYAAAGLSFNIGDYVTTPNKGLTRSEEVKEKCRQATIESWKRGRTPYSEEAMSNFRQSAEARRGVPRSQEVKDKISKSKKGKRKPEGFGEKVSSIHKGRKRSDEFKAKVSAGMKKYKEQNPDKNKGTKRSDSFKAKVSEGLRRYHLKKKQELAT